MKECHRCLKSKPLNSFVANARRKDGKNEICKECVKKRNIKVRQREEPLTHRQCRKCQKVKSVSDFHKDAGSPGGHSSICKACKIEYQRNLYPKDTKLYDKRKLSRRLSARKHRDKQLVRQRISYRNNIQTNIRHKVRGSIAVALNRMKKGLRKKDSSIKYLGCTYAEYKTYLESLFSEGMTWEKFLLAEIHIDHIIPIRHFDLTISEEQAKAFHYTNTQPLWAGDNLIKTDRLPDGTLARNKRYVAQLETSHS